MILLRLFFEFFKVGLFSVGGGLATLPFLYRISDKTGWFTSAQLADMFAVSESTPGPIGVNMATYTGYTTAGIPGALAATLGLISPCIIVILIVAEILDKFRTNAYVDAALKGLRPASAALIAAVLLNLLLTNLLTPIPEASFGCRLDLASAEKIILAVLVFFGMRKFKKIHPIVFLAIGAAAGILLGW